MNCIFTGNGKGKTTAAVGMGMRMVGAGKKVLLIRFLKEKEISSEEKIIQKIKNFEIKSFGRKGFFLPENELKKNSELKKMGVKPLAKKDHELFREGFDLAERAANKKEYELLILDEVILGIKFNLIKKEEIINFLRKYGKSLDIVLTGRHCPPEIFKFADIVTEMKEIKHPYQKGEKAKKGIGY